MGYYFASDSDHTALEQRWMLYRQRAREHAYRTGCGRTGRLPWASGCTTEGLEARGGQVEGIAPLTYYEWRDRARGELIVEVWQHVRDCCPTRLLVSFRSRGARRAECATIRLRWERQPIGRRRPSIWVKLVYCGTRNLVYAAPALLLLMRHPQPRNGLAPSH